MGVASFAADEPEGWAALFEQARVLDRAGVDRLVVSDHVVFGERMEEYGRPDVGGRAGGKQPTGPDGHWLEPLTTLSVLVGVTQRIRLGTGILIAALRRPVVLAKAAATLDVLSGGRLDLGVGVGWQREEYEAAGLPFERRGILLDQCLDVCQTLWRERRARFDAPDLHFQAIHMMPKPLQRGGVPIWVSGRVNPRVVHRLIRYGSGWIPWGDDADDVTSGIGRMRAALEEAGHDPAGLRVVGSLPLRRRTDRTVDLEATMDAVPHLVASGVTDFRLGLRLPSDSSEALDQLSAAVAAFRRAAGRSDAL